MLLTAIQNSYQNYFKFGARSNKKIKYLHAKIAEEINTFLPPEYVCHSEVKIPCFNFSNEKRADLAIMDKNGDCKIYIPVKFICRNYIKNRNNLWESLLGECLSVQFANPGIKIIPLNIYLANTPKNKKKFENLNLYFFNFMKNMSPDFITPVTVICNNYRNWKEIQDIDCSNDLFKLIENSL